MERSEMEAAIEAILFATGRAVSSADLARALEAEVSEVDEAARAMAARWAEETRGTDLIPIEDGWQMCTRKTYYPQLITLELTPKKPRLTDVLLETLSVIAYKQPVTKPEIERIRGVNSDHAVNKLVEYHLVRELGRAKLPGRPILFGTTQDFLRVFGVSSKETLPEIPPAQMEDFREQAEEEAGVQPAEAGTQPSEDAPEEAGTNPAEGAPEEAGARPEEDAPAEAGANPAEDAPADSSADRAAAAAAAAEETGETSLPIIDRGEMDRIEGVGI